jgi:hypothetical protein
MPEVKWNKLPGMGMDASLSITADDRIRDLGNMSHEYKIFGGSPDGPQGLLCTIRFQNGPVKENGINGVSNEALIAVVLDRLSGAQDGQWKCRENALAITKLEEAVHWLHHRTIERCARNVEGTSKV